MCMMKNNIRQQRHKLGLTQKQLADLAGTSQQQIQRIEAGQYVKLDLATKICASLQSTLEELFPSTKKAIARFSKKSPAKRAEPDAELDNAMDEAGIDVDPAEWSIRYRLKNGLEGVWRLSSKDKDRLISCSQNPGKFFFCGTSHNREFAVSMRHLSFFQPCFDYGTIVEEHDENEPNDVKVYLADSTIPLVFQVEPDCELNEDETDEGELRNLLYSFDDFDEHTEEDPFIHFNDEDGEYAFLRTDQVALIEIPLWATHPEMEDDADDKSAEPPPAK